MKYSSLPVIVFGVIGALIAAIYFKQIEAFGLQDVTAEKVGGVFLTLIFVALVIERATEVYVNTSLEPERQGYLKKVRGEAAKVRAARVALEAERSSPSPSAPLLSKLETTLQEAEKGVLDEAVKASPQVEVTRNKIARQAAIVAAVLGVLIALSGVRALNPFLAEGAIADHDFQQGLFAGIDVLVTGALLAGGADGLHKLVERFLQYAGKKDELPLA